MIPPGHQLRLVREQLGYTLREVESATQRIAQKYSNEEFAVSLSRLSDIETKSVVPSIFRLYALAVVYRREIRELLQWYGVDLEGMTTDQSLADPPRTHIAHGYDGNAVVNVPVRLDPAFDLSKTTNLGRMIERWGTVPFALLAQLAQRDFTYGYIGTEDFTMYPLLQPGSFVQVDESRNVVEQGMWRWEFERPIYFVETRDGHVCCWCATKDSSLVLQPHPLSPQPVRILRHPQEAEVLGQVVAVAMRLDQFTQPAALRDPKEPAKLN